ncbi:AcvB/VirJ family lysyl-phosphatidylglycerol hydrolase [Metallibacterium sp.]|uniref:AcvB/VirJ family lysyl-phosphatidylglycerol hydrolase n=1 Tax=Metallibacterium sp. TaxID=2940281 RepID=UPI0026285793|nr:AcvB/VirJ family lysyl-phosphatidylglycerol hydrolase [Metallibacterium sp.]
MRKLRSVLLPAVLLLSLAGVAVIPRAHAAPPPIADATYGAHLINYGLFGPVRVYQPTGIPQRAVIVFSRTTGWGANEARYATGLQQAGSLVIGVDLPRYLKTLEALEGKCSYPAGHVEEMSHWMQKTLRLPTYLRPFIIGFDGGADFTYALGVQAPSGTFAGMATLGWDGQFTLPHAFCKGDAGNATVTQGKVFGFAPVTPLPLPWLAAGSPGKNEIGPPVAFGRALRAPADGAALATALDALVRKPVLSAGAFADKLEDLPLTEIAPKGTPDGRVVVMFSGDGGWAGLDKGVAKVLSAHGVRVVGLSSLEYFWHKKTPQQTAQALARILAAYTARYPDARYTLMGYSFGAGVVPVVYNLLPPELKQHVGAEVLISPDPEGWFDIHIGDWFTTTKHQYNVPLDPEIARTRIPVICLSGQTEGHDTYCDSLARRGMAKLVTLPGGHHYQGDYDRLGRVILQALPR